MDCSDINIVKLGKSLFKEYKIIAVSKHSNQHNSHTAIWAGL